MAEAIIKSVTEVTEENLDGDAFYAFWCDAFPKGGDDTATQPCKVLAKSSNKWGAGMEVELTSTDQEWEGPDGRTYFYCKFKKPGDSKFGGNRGGGRQTSNRPARADKPMESITAADAQSVHARFLEEAATDAVVLVGQFVDQFEEGGLDKDCIFEQLCKTAVAIGNQRFSLFMKSFRIATPGGAKDAAAEAAEKDAAEAKPSKLFG